MNTTPAPDDEKPRKGHRQFAHFGILDNGRQSKGSLFVSIIINVLLALVAILLGLAAKRISNHRPIEHVATTIGLPATRLLAAIIVVILGWVANRFKRWQQYYYGLVEVVFAGLTAWNVSAGLSTHDLLLLKWAVLLGTGYIAARGLGNMQDGKPKRLTLRITASR